MTSTLPMHSKVYSMPHSSFSSSTCEWQMSQGLEHLLESTALTEPASTPNQLQPAEAGWLTTPTIVAKLCQPADRRSVLAGEGPPDGAACQAQARLEEQ